MTPADFRAWRRRMGLTREALLAVLRDLGWMDLSLRSLDNWGVRGVLQHALPTLALMERVPEAWRGREAVLELGRST